MKKEDIYSNFDVFFKKKLCFQNREISWLKFNERVLNEATSSTVPLFERLKFIAIFSSNLDEFFRVRIAKIFNRLNFEKNNDGLKELLKIIFSLVVVLLKKQAKIFKRTEKNLQFFKLNSVKLKKLNLNQKVALSNLALKLNCFVLKKNFNFDEFKSGWCYFVLELENRFNGKIKVLIYSFSEQSFKFLFFKKSSNVNYILLESLLLKFLPYNKKNYKLLSEFRFKVVRSVELSCEFKSFLKLFNKVDYIKIYLNKIKNLNVTGLFYNGKPSKRILKFFQNGFKISKFQIFKVKVPLLMDYVFNLQKCLSKKQQKILCYKNSKNKNLNFLKYNLYSRVHNYDLLLFFPYNPVEEFLNFLNEAAFDENVVEIKITLYRVASDSILVEILKIAAKKNKKVVVVVELLARFDEEQNLKLSGELKKAGCKVLFGFKTLKIHSKICVVVKKNKFVLTQIGTGNYNEKTAKQYSDLSFFTSNKKIGQDALKFFDSVENFNFNVAYSTLLVAPINLKEKILNLIEIEQKKGKNGQIFMKMNALTDYCIIKKLISASKKGVKIVLNVRGSCCLLPGIKNLTDNVEIFSVVGRFLEHARIYCFGRNFKTMKIFIGSADMMTRNIERRVEVLVPIFSNELKFKILKIVKILKQDNSKSRYLTKHGKLKANVFKLKKVDSQEQFSELF